MLTRRAVLLAAAVGLTAPAALAENKKPAAAGLKLHPLFTDNMVLQRGAKLPVWGKAGPGEKVEVTLERSGEAGAHSLTAAEAVAGDDGSWKVELPPAQAGTGYTLTLKGKSTVALKNVAVGEVWVCSGQSNMEWSVNADQNPDKIKGGAKDAKLRLFTVQKRTAAAPVTDIADMGNLTKWVESGPDTVGGFSAVGYHFGAYLRKNLPGDVPVGLIHTSWGGTPAEAWASQEALEAVAGLKYYADNARKQFQAVAEGKKNFDAAKAKATYDEAMTKYKEAAAQAKADGKPAPKAPALAKAPEIGPHTPGSLYNGMIAPLLPYAVEGAIWYQGESNAGRAFEYRTLLPTMIRDWRAKWNSDLPFMVVQLAPFMAVSKQPQESNWAELREAQYLTTTALPKVGLAVITDVGDEKDIHPRPKKPVGDRLAIAALNIAYGQPVEPTGPTFKALRVEGNKAVVAFDHLGGGLEAKGGSKLTGFTIAGEDRKFVNADAEIQGDTVVVSSPDVTAPVAVRFGWANFPVVNLWGKGGLPAVPFRTDDFPITTAPKAAAPKKAAAKEKEAAK